MASDLRGGEAWAVLTSAQLRPIPRRSPGLDLTALPPGSSSLCTPAILPSVELPPRRRALCRSKMQPQTCRNKRWPKSRGPAEAPWRVGRTAWRLHAPP